MEDLISVIIPIYNVEKYIDKCLVSMLNQTYKNMEFILVDDGSPDRCGEICDEYAKKDSRIKVIHKKNGGVASARNTGLEFAHGKYIGFSDPDDYVENNMFEVLYNAIKLGDCDISVCSYYEVYDDRTERKYIADDNMIISANDGVVELVNDDTFKNFTWNKLYKTNVIKDLRFPDLCVMEDATLNYRAFLKSKKIAVVNKALYYYIQRQGSLTANKSLRNRMDLYKFHSTRYEALADMFPHKIETLTKYKVLSAFSLLVKLRLIKEKDNFTEIYEEAYGYLKSNRKLIKKLRINNNTKIKISLFLIDYRLFFLINGLYKGVKYIVNRCRLFQN